MRAPAAPSRRASWPASFRSWAQAQRSPLIAREGHQRLFESLDAVLADLCRVEPVVVVLEDLHWADEMSLRLFAFVARRLVGRPLLLVLSSRDEDLAETPALARLVDELTPLLPRRARRPRRPVGPGHGHARARPRAGGQPGRPSRRDRGPRVGSQRGQSLRHRRDDARAARRAPPRRRRRRAAAPRARDDRGPDRPAQPARAGAGPRRLGVHPRVRVPRLAAGGRARPARDGGSRRGAGATPHLRRRRRALRLHPFAPSPRRLSRPARPSPAGAPRRDRRGRRGRVRGTARRGVRPARPSLLARRRAGPGPHLSRAPGRQGRARVRARRSPAPAEGRPRRGRAAAPRRGRPPAPRRRVPARPRAGPAGPPRRGARPPPPSRGPRRRARPARALRALSLLARVHVRQPRGQPVRHEPCAARARGGGPRRRQRDHGQGQLFALAGELHDRPPARGHRPGPPGGRLARAERRALVAGPGARRPRPPPAAHRRLRPRPRDPGPHARPRRGHRRGEASGQRGVDDRSGPHGHGRCRSRHRGLSASRRAGGRPGRPGGCRRLARRGLPRGRPRGPGHRPPRGRASAAFSS